MTAASLLKLHGSQRENCKDRLLFPHTAGAEVQVGTVSLNERGTHA